jgi:hypothetical protein
MGAATIPLQVGAGVTPIQSPAQTMGAVQQAQSLAGAVAIQKQVQLENDLKIRQQQQQLQDQQALNDIISKITPPVPVAAPTDSGTAATPSDTTTSGAKPSLAATAANVPGVTGSLLAMAAASPEGSLAGATPSKTAPVSGATPTNGVPSVASLTTPAGTAAPTSLSKGYLSDLMSSVWSDPRISYPGKQATIQHALDMMKAIGENDKTTIANNAAWHNQTVGLIEGVLQAKPEDQQGQYLAARAQAIADKNPDANNWPTTFPGVAALEQVRQKYMLATDMWKEAENLPEKQQKALAEAGQQMQAVIAAPDPKAAYKQVYDNSSWIIRKQLPTPESFSTSTIDTVMKMAQTPEVTAKLPGELADAQLKVASATAGRLSNVLASKGQDAYDAEVAKISDPDIKQRFEGLTTPSSVMRAGLTPQQAIRTPIGGRAGLAAAANDPTKTDDERAAAQAALEDLDRRQRGLTANALEIQNRYDQKRADKDVDTAQKDSLEHGKLRDQEIDQSTLLNRLQTGIAAAQSGKGAGPQKNMVPDPHNPGSDTSPHLISMADAQALADGVREKAATAWDSQAQLRQRHQWGEYAPGSTPVPNPWRQAGQANAGGGNNGGGNKPAVPKVFPQAKLADYATANHWTKADGTPDVDRAKKYLTGNGYKLQ